MAKPYKLLRERMSAAARHESETQARQMLREMALDEMRLAREKTQQELAKLLGVNQAAVSKLEGRLDMYVSTLRKYVEALGGQLEITARFADGTTVRVSQFETEEAGAKKKIKPAAFAR
jgi:transcriptional regulator with XRE-family HTH domain